MLNVQVEVRQERAASASSPEGQLGGTGYLLLHWSFEEAATVITHHRLHFASKEAQA